jgi:hypothetical protein
MENMDRFFKLRHVEDAKRPACISNPDFLDSRSNCRHRFPIIQLFPLLDFKELKAGCFLCAVRKLTKILP